MVNGEWKLLSISYNPDAGRDWGQEEKGTTEDEVDGWHHRLDAHEFRWTPGVGDRWEGWCAAIHGVAKSRTQLSEWTELNWSWCYDLVLEKAETPCAPSLCLVGEGGEVEKEEKVTEEMWKGERESPSVLSASVASIIPIHLLTQLSFLPLHFQCNWGFNLRRIGCTFSFTAFPAGVQHVFINSLWHLE